MMSRARAAFLGIFVNLFAWAFTWRRSMFVGKGAVALKQWYLVHVGVFEYFCLFVLRRLCWIGFDRFSCIGAM